LNYQHFTSSNTLAINFLVCINPFFVDGGCSFVLPGSHMFSEFPSNEYINKHETPLEAEAGSVILMNAMTYHRAGKNITKNFIRRAINHVVGQPFITQQISIPKLLMLNNNDLSSDPFLSKYLGYKWNTADDIKSWVDLRK
jgi:ectoine hydroxylase-related dioxygenase (phytanoyl-CoA dioxygenase family)